MIESYIPAIGSEEGGVPDGEGIDGIERDRVMRVGLIGDVENLRGRTLETK